MHLPSKFHGSYVYSFGSHRVDKKQTHTRAQRQTNRRRWRHPTLFTTLRRWVIMTKDKSQCCLATVCTIMVIIRGLYIYNLVSPMLLFHGCTFPLLMSEIVQPLGLNILMNRIRRHILRWQTAINQEILLHIYRRRRHYTITLTWEIEVKSSVLPCHISKFGNIELSNYRKRAVYPVPKSNPPIRWCSKQFTYGQGYPKTAATSVNWKLWEPCCLRNTYPDTVLIRTGNRVCK